MSALTLMDMLRLRRVAQMATDSASSVDQNAMAETLAGLNIAGLSTAALVPHSLNLPPSPPNIIDLHQLEAAIHKRQQEEQAAEGLRPQELQQKHQPLQQAAAPPAQVVDQETLQEIPVKEVAVQPQKKHKDKATVKKATAQDQLPVELALQEEPAVQRVQQSTAATAGTTNAARKKKRKSKNATAAAAAETKSEENPVNEGSLEPEDDWVAVPPSGATFHPQPIPSNATLWHGEVNNEQPTKKSKRKKKGK